MGRDGGRKNKLKDKIGTINTRVEEEGRRRLREGQRREEEVEMNGRRKKRERKR